ncbi:MAG TPA: glycosyltransferase family 39 protein [Thermoanaerobaculia bacterium]|nr:glycosyltransferase family 39 protein [Thermoanaerobaculia bacterium]HUM29157.1 glycosyltransferase family 39 protein [Thermoanaerobaculia bacterium]HXK67534.1 glycosyltransferase family 39 protein [Thermoanaerobaculia bacterium]
MKRAIMILALIALLRVVLALVTPVSGDEAYYWDCARNMDWSYFDQPPLVIWAVALFRPIMGNTSLALRFLPILAAFLSGYLLLLLSLRLSGTVRYGLTAYLVLQLTPLFFFGSFYLSTDSALIPCWLWALYALVRILRGDPRFWIHFGLATGLGFLAKFPIVLILPLAFLIPRKFWNSVYVFHGAAFSLLLTAPVWIWAGHHHFNNIAFQLVGRHEGASAGIGHFFEFWAAQLLLLGPVLPVLAVGRIVRLWRSWWEEPCRRIVFLAGFIPIAFFGLVAFRDHAGAHWIAPGFFPLALLITLDRPLTKRQVVGSLIPACLIILLAMVPVFAPGLLARTHSIPSKIAGNFFGYQRLADRLKQEPPEVLTASTSYSLVSLAGYRSGGSLSPLLIRSRGGRHGLSYLYWQEHLNLAGKDVLFYSTRDDIIKYASEICERTDPPEYLDIVTGGRTVRQFILVRGYDIQNVEPFLPE